MMQTDFRDPADLIERGVAHHRAGRMHEAEVCYRQALAADSRNSDGWHLLGMVADAAGQAAAAIELINHARTLAPHRADILNNLGTIYEAQGLFDLAEASLREAIRLCPDYAIAHNNLGEVMKDFGRANDSINCYRLALKYSPNFREAVSNLLMTLNYDPCTNRQSIFVEHRRFGTQSERASTPLPLPKHNRDIHRRLRVGYLSPDFRKHAVARFFEPILTAHDRTSFELFLYSECPKVDAVTQRLQSLAGHWRKTWKQNADDVARQIRSDQIDILVDLAGHTRNNRLDVFVRRPAPVQVTYLGYPNTTGLSTVDYRITDAILDPENEAKFSSEKIIHLPGHAFCFLPPASTPEIAPPPSTRSGVVTFGSHHPPIKLNDQVLRLWARVLEAVPNSRLLMFRDSLHAVLQREFKTRLVACHVPLDRVEMRSPTVDEPSYLDLYKDIDIVLDCFPFTGHTMTCEALWMGVPVLTLRGDRPCGRLSASVLLALGLSDLIAESHEHYITRAQEWTAAVERRAVLRSQLRQLIRDRLCNAELFTPELEARYRGMWQAWCTSEASKPSTPTRRAE